MDEYKCIEPDITIRCAWCGCTFRCADAPHDIEGPLCPSCGRGEDLREIDK